MNLEAYYNEFGSAKDVLRIREINNVGICRNDEVCIKVITSSVNQWDIQFRKGLKGTLNFPEIVPHNDGAGIVVKIGKCVKSFKVGDRVWVYNANWKRAFGTASSYCILPESQVALLPNNIDFDQGACLGIPAITAYACLSKEENLNKKTILISGGAGRVSSLAIQIALIMGARIITTVSSDEKKEYVKSINAHHIVDYKNKNVFDEIMNITNGIGVDYVVDVDFNQNLNWSISSLKPGGKLVSYSSISNKNPTIPFYSIMAKNVELYFISVFTISDYLRSKAIDFINMSLMNGSLKPNIWKKFDIKEIVKAHESLENNNNIIGSVLLGLN